MNETAAASGGLRAGPGVGPSWPTRRLRRAGMAAAAAGIALLASACSGGGGASPGGSAPDSVRQMAAYSRCMRAHGDPRFPEPVRDSTGAWQYPAEPHTELAGPGYDTALNSCHKLQPRGGLTAAERRAATYELLALARCMRTHGIRNFPGPTASGDGGVETYFGPGSGVDTRSPQFKAALQDCYVQLPFAPLPGPTVGVAG
jgi:hypothetical protein